MVVRDELVREVQEIGWRGLCQPSVYTCTPYYTYSTQLSTTVCLHQPKAPSDPPLTAPLTAHSSRWPTLAAPSPASCRYRLRSPEQKFELVAGSLGYGVGGAPHYEYGGPTYTTLKQFTHSAYGPGADAHMWVQTETGNIIDVFTPMHARMCVDIWHKQVSIQGGTIIAGLTRDHLQSLGLHYVPAPNSFQQPLLQRMLKCTLF